MQIFQILIICGAIATYCAAVSDESTENISEKVELSLGLYPVVLDNFRPQDGRVPQFYYRMNIQNYQVGGPIFIFVNDAGRYETQWLQQGLMVDIARNVGGVLVAADHRFFGDSLPTNAATFEELSYLTTEQYLSDIAHLITTIKQHINSPNARVILWGSGYGATIATWAKQKYPHLINGVWASSAVFQREAFTSDVYENLAYIIEEFGGSECADRVRSAFEYIDDVVQSGDEEDLITLQNDLSLCAPVNATSDMDVAFFHEGMINFIMSHIDAHHQFGVLTFCSGMRGIEENTFASFARWVRFQYLGDSGRCFNFDYSEREFWVSSPTWNWPGTFAGWRQVLYLVCTQLGLLRTTSQGGMFGHRVTEQYNYQTCVNAFGPNYSFERLYQTLFHLEVRYGGNDPSIENVIFTNGLLDAFAPLGMTENYEEDSISLLIPGVSKSADLTSLSPGDPAFLHEAKQTIVNRITRWATDDS